MVWADVDNCKILSGNGHRYDIMLLFAIFAFGYFNIHAKSCELAAGSLVSAEQGNKLLWQSLYSLPLYAIFS